MLVRRAATLVELLVIIFILSVVYSLLVVGILKARSVSNSLYCKSNLRQMGIGLVAHHDLNNHFPSGCELNVDFSGMPYSSWRLKILPQISEEASFKVALADY